MMKALLNTLLCLGLAAAAAGGPHLGKTLGQWRAQLASPDRVERLLAARSLGEMAIGGDPEAATALFSAIEHKDSAVRYWAVVAAGRMGDKARPAIDRLDAARRDEAPEVRVWAAYALVKIGRTQEGMETLIAEMGNAEKGARLQAAHAIDALGPEGKAATEALRQAMTDEFDYVQRVSRHALWVLGERPCPYRRCP